eukprot:TRINITY_DN9351_c0_g1_i1.p1 TRINITY_DN9351_c0_g1~~TRINITY_DN9351_c0_g1_i1.p1  ORF type:complete len:519 (-),score=60.35 TRINITY_DN9351_c0_g1_i1:13-1518(-)
MSNTSGRHSKLYRDYTCIAALLAISFVLDRTFFLVILLLSLLFVRWRKEIYLLWSVIEPRITGNINFAQTILDIAREEGKDGDVLNDIVRFDIPFFKPIFVVIKPSYIRKILSLDVGNFYTSGHVGPMVMLTDTGDNILLRPGPPDEMWKNQRELTAPLNLDRFGEDSLVANLFRASWKICNRLAEEMSDQRGKPLDLFKYLFHFMITANNVSIFGEEFSYEAFPGLTDDMYKAVLHIGVDLLAPNILVSRKATEEKKRVTSETYQKIKYMVNKSTSPLLTHLKNAVKDKKLPQAELESLMAVVGYAHAPLHTVFWLCYNMARHPEVQTKLVIEIENTLASGPLTYSKLAEMTYLSQVLSETLRIYPGVALLQPRTARSDCVLGHHYIPKGSTLMVYPYISHRNGKYYKDPDTFNPERENLDTTNSGSKLKHIPFGFGPRICRGQFYAECLVKAAIISIVRRYTIKLVDGEPEIHGEEVGFCRPSKNVKFLFGKRNVSKIM